MRTLGGFLLKEAARGCPPPPMTFGRLANISEFSSLLKRGCQGTEITWETDMDRGSINVLAVLLWVFSPKDPPPSTTREAGDQTHLVSAVVRTSVSPEFTPRWWYREEGLWEAMGSQGGSPQMGSATS